MVAFEAVSSHLVVIFTAAFLCCHKPVTDLNTLDSTNTHHRSGNECIQLPKDRITKSCRTPGCNNLHNSTNRVTSLFCRKYFPADLVLCLFPMHLKDCPSDPPPVFGKYLHCHSPGSH